MNHNHEHSRVSERLHSITEKLFLDSNGYLYNLIRKKVHTCWVLKTQGDWKKKWEVFHASHWVAPNWTKPHFEIPRICDTGRKSLSLSIFFYFTILSIFTKWEKIMTIYGFLRTLEIIIHLPIQPAFLVIPCSNLEHVHRNTWKILTRKAVSFAGVFSHSNVWFLSLYEWANNKRFSSFCWQAEPIIIRTYVWDVIHS